MKTVTIDRKTWRRGGNKMKLGEVGDTALLNAQGNRCCLGFHCGVEGIPDGKLSGREFPGEVGMVIPGLTYMDQYNECCNSDYSCAAADINDDRTITESEREKKLKALAKRNGFRYKFIGKTPSEYWDRRWKRQ